MHILKNMFEIEVWNISKQPLYPPALDQHWPVTGPHPCMLQASVFPRGLISGRKLAILAQSMTNSH